MNRRDKVIKLPKTSVLVDKQPNAAMENGSLIGKLSAAFIFLALWSFFMVIIFGIVMLTNIDWGRSRFEKLMTQSLHRHVTLGHLSLTLGLGGMSIYTTKMSIAEPDGSPFLKTGTSEIGIALTPLLLGHLKIKHLQFSEPELWAVRTGKNTWNFSDLMQTAIDVNSLQTTKGTIHIIDRSGSIADAFSKVELKNVETKLIRLGKYIRKPNALSFTLAKPNQNIDSRFEFRGLLLGRTPDWRASPCTLKIKADNINVAEIELAQAVFNIDLSRILVPLHEHQVKGLFQVVFTASGTLNDKFQGQVQIKAHSCSFVAQQFGHVKTQELNARLNLKADKDNLVWQNSTIDLPAANAHIRTEGVLQHWRNYDDLAFDGTLVGMFDNLTNLFSEISLTDPQQPTRELRLQQLQGRALIDAHVNRPTSQSITNITSRLTLSDVLVKGLLDALPGEAAAAFCTLNLNEQSVLSGDIELDGTNKMKFDNCTLTSGTTKFKISGMADMIASTGKFNLSAKGFPLADISQGMKNSGSLIKRLLTSFRPGSDKTLNFSGKTDFSLVFEQMANQARLNAEANLIQAKIIATAPPLSFEQINGSFEIHPNELVFKNVSGSIGQGHLTISGKLPAQAHGNMKLVLEGTNLNVEDLGSLLNLANVDLPILTKHELTGSTRELKISLTGTKAKPILSFVATPAKLLFRSAGLATPLQAVAGTILYNNDELTLRDVTLELQTGSVLANLVIKNLSGAATCDQIRLKSTGIEAKEADELLSSTLAPPPVKKLYLDMKHAQNITLSHGRIQTDITYRGETDRAEFEGQISLTNVGLKVGKKETPLEHLAGTLSFSDEGIKADEISGNVWNSTFTANAMFPKSYRVPKPWHLDLKAQINPSDVENITSAASEQNGMIAPELSARGPTFIKIKCEGQNQAQTTLVTIYSAKDSALSMKLPIGIFHQPPGQPLFFEGMIRSRASEHAFVVSDAHLTVAQDTLFLAGKFSRPNDYEISIKSPKLISVKYLKQMLEPPLFQTDVDGRIKGAITIFSTPANSRLTGLKGSVTFEKLSLPQFGLDDLSGQFVAYEPKGATAANSVGKLKLKEIRVARLKISDLTAELEWFSPDYAPNQKIHQPSVKVTGLHGSLADGDLYGNALLQSSSQTFSLHTYLSKASAARLLEDLTALKGELTGILDAEVDFSSVGKTGSEFTANLCGHGTVNVRNGSVSRFGRLQAKINQVNLLHQGLFGFNLNNLLQSVVPVRSGDFTLLTAAWRLANGKLSFDELRYNGDDMRLWAAGEANLPMHTIELEIAGQIPRVTSSVLSGTVGGLSKEITVQRVMDSITHHKLQTLPSLPILGDFASARPRVFMFRVLAPYDQPKTLSQSIEKSFHWLPSKPNATAHPVFGSDYN